MVINNVCWDEFVYILVWNEWDGDDLIFNSKYLQMLEECMQAMHIQNKQSLLQYIVQRLPCCTFDVTNCFKVFEILQNLTVKFVT